MKRKVNRELSIASGNAAQGAMLVGGVALLWTSSLQLATALRVLAMVVGYLLVYFSVHASAHYAIGRLLGIRFTHYSVGGSTHAASYPPGMRQVFERLPFFAVHSDKMSLKAASPVAKALMFGAGMTSSVLLCTLAALWCLAAGVPGATILLIVNVVWYLAALIAEMRQGDYVKAAKALRDRVQ